MRRKGEKLFYEEERDSDVAENCPSAVHQPCFAFSDSAVLPHRASAA